MEVVRQVIFAANYHKATQCCLGHYIAKRFHGASRNVKLTNCLLNPQIPAVWFFVLCNRHWFNRVPEANLGIACLPFTFNLTLAVPTYPCYRPSALSFLINSLSLSHPLHHHDDVQPAAVSRLPPPPPAPPFGTASLSPHVTLPQHPRNTQGYARCVHILYREHIL